MRENTQALRADSAFSVITGTDGLKWGKLVCSSPRDAHNFARKYARTPNESQWTTYPRWIGLDTQAFPDFEETGIAHYPRSQVEASKADLPASSFRPSQSRAAVTGALWDVPAVLANIPLAARTRVRTKIAPVNLKISFAYSGMIDEKEITPRIAKLARAIWGYTMKGGAVTLTVYNTCLFSGNYGKLFPSDIKGLIVETKVNAADVAALALATSPAFFRSIAAPLQSACSLQNGDMLYPHETPLPGVIQASGISQRIHEALDKAIEALRIE